MNLGIFFELLWLDLFPAGTVIPPHALFALTASLTVLASLDEPNMRLTTLVLVASFPLASLGAWVEHASRIRQNLNFTALLVWSRRKSASVSPQTPLILRALGEQFTLCGGIFVLCASALLALTRVLGPWIAEGVQPEWFMLWVGASIGAILALRIRTGYAVGAASLILGILIGL
ncbi:MAG: hypothetical protein KBF11_03555 [Desulfomicrobium sp.]|nr:hypothetical protein [Desulfomicrobium sp.]